MGSRGPVPKHSSERRRRNKKGKAKSGSAKKGATKKAKASKSKRKPAGAYKPPAANKKWHPVAKKWYESLKRSGQSDFYQPSDWAMAYMVAESISRDLLPQVVAVPEKTGEPVFEKVPMKGASLSAYLKAMSSLMVSEGDRRRVGVELERVSEQPSEEEKSEGVVALDDYRKRLSG